MISCIMRVGRKFGNCTKLLSAIGIVSVGLALVMSGVALAGCTDLGLESGPAVGGSITNCVFSISQNNTTVTVNVSCAPVAYGNYGFGCNRNWYGQGYLINGARFDLVYPNGHVEPISECNYAVRISTVQGRYTPVYTFTIDKNNKDEGQYCIKNPTYWRNHFCQSVPGSYSMSGNNCFTIPYAWWAEGWSWNNGNIKYPGDTIYWTHQVRNDGPSTVRYGDLAYNVDAWDGYNDDRVISKYSASGHLNAGRLSSGSSVYWYGQRGPLSQDDVGKQYCQRVHWYPQSTSNATTVYAGWSCTKVPYDYSTLQYSNLAQINGQEVTSNKVVKPKQTVRGHYQLENYSWSHTKTLAIGWSNGINIKRGGAQIGSLANASGTFPEGYLYPGHLVNSRQSSDLPTHFETVPETINGNHVDANDQVCAWMQTDNRNYAHNYGADGGSLGSARYTEDCATVPYHYPGCAYGYGGDCTNKWDSPDPSYNCVFEGSCDGQAPKEGTGVQPSVSATATSIQDGESFKFTYSIKNNGPTKTKNIGYTVHIFRMQNGYAYNEANHNDKALFKYDVDVDRRTVYKRIRNYGSTNSGSRTLSWNENYTFNMTADSSSMPGEVGDLICSYITLDNNWAVYEGRSSNTYLSSNVKCVRIGKRPQMQINGSDSYASGGFASWGQTGSNRGSYTQYAQITNSGKTTNFGSAGYTWGRLDAAIRMIYANASGAGSSASSSDIRAGRLSYGDVDAIVKQLKLKHGSEVEFHNGEYKIDGDIISDNVNSVRTIVVDGDIDISSNVSRIDAVLIATGRVNTCSDSGISRASGNLSIASGCAKRLIINGAVVSGKSPAFRRTWGGGNVSGVNHFNNYSEGATAEMISYTPNIWLNANKFSGGTIVEEYTVTSETSAPVRY